jgi:uncharacterized membrane protein YkoI
MRGYVLIMMGSILAAGLGLLSHLSLQLVRPAVPTGEIAVMDERPVALGAQFLLSNALQEDADLTLLTVSEPPTASPIITSIEPVADGLSMDALMQMLAQARPEATIREIRVKREQGVTIYEVDFSDGYRIRLDAASGQMLTLDTIRRGPSQPPHRRLQGVVAQTTLLEAVAVAQQRQPAAALRDAKLEIHDGLMVYKVKFEHGIDVFLDANTGEHLFTKLPRGAWDTSSLLIQPEEAVQNALALYPQAALREWKPKFEAGTVAYEIKLTNRIEVYVSAFDGRVLHVETDD